MRFAFSTIALTQIMGPVGQTKADQAEDTAQAPEQSALTLLQRKKDGKTGA